MVESTSEVAQVSAPQEMTRTTTDGPTSLIRRGGHHADTSPSALISSSFWYFYEYIPLYESIIWRLPMLELIHPAVHPLQSTRKFRLIRQQQHQQPHPTECFPPSFNGTFSSFTLTHQLQINFITWLNRKQCTAAPAHFKRWVAYLTTRFFLTSKYLSLRPSLVKYGSKSLNF